MQPLKNEFPAKMLCGIPQKVDDIEHGNQAVEDRQTRAPVGADVDDLKLVTQTVDRALLKKA